MNRRSFLKLTGLAALGSLAKSCAPTTDTELPPSPSAVHSLTPVPSAVPSSTPTPSPEIGEAMNNPEEFNRSMETNQMDEKSKVALVMTSDRNEGINRALSMVSPVSFHGKSVFLKPNFNSDDPFPGSTHIDTLHIISSYLKSDGASRIIIGDRSGMGDTRSVMENLGVFDLAEEVGFETLIFNELDSSGWLKHSPTRSHWENGFATPAILHEVDSIVQTCCLKTHRYGGHFTMSLKNSVGLVAQKIPGDSYDYMNELHGSSYQREMIAEINLVYQPSLIILDAIDAFTKGGPATGDIVSPNVIIVGTDRIAIDALGVALLRKYGTTPAVENGPVFEQDQIARAVEIGLGAQSPTQIEILTDDPESFSLGEELSGILLQG